MKWQQQVALFDRIIAEEKRILDQKGHEYAGVEDALGNFKKRAADIGIDPKQILWVFLAKHLDSIKSFIREGKELSEEKIDGRINDARNYLFLLQCLVEEERSEKNKCPNCDGLGRHYPADAPCIACNGSGELIRE